MIVSQRPPADNLRTEHIGRLDIPWVRDHDLRMGLPVGSASGYRTLEAAVTDLAAVTSEFAPDGGATAAIVKDGDVFRARDVLNVEPATFVSIDRQYYYDMGSERERAIIVEPDEIVALVQGNRATYRQPGTDRFAPPSAPRPLPVWQRAAVLHDADGSAPQPLHGTAPLGRPDGYVSLQDAVRAIGELTNGAGAGSAVIARDGARFVARELLRDVNTKPDSVREPHQPKLERFQAARTPGTYDWAHDTAVAIVDGDFVVMRPGA